MNDKGFNDKDCPRGWVIPNHEDKQRSWVGLLWEITEQGSRFIYRIRKANLELAIFSNVRFN